MRALKDIDIAFLPMNLPYTMSMSSRRRRRSAPSQPGFVYPYHYNEQRHRRLRPAGRRVRRPTEVVLHDWYPTLTAGDSSHADRSDRGLRGAGHLPVSACRRHRAGVLGARHETASLPRRDPRLPARQPDPDRASATSPAPSGSRARPRPS